MRPGNHQLGKTDAGRLPTAAETGRSCAGLSPSHAHSDMQLTTVMNFRGRLDLTMVPGNSCLNISLPLGRVSADVLEGLERAFIASGGEQLQPNCVRLEDLEDAMIHPEAHRDLLSGCSDFPRGLFCCLRNGSASSSTGISTPHEAGEFLREDRGGSRGSVVSAGTMSCPSDLTARGEGGSGAFSRGRSCGTGEPGMGGSALCHKRN